MKIIKNWQIEPFAKVINDMTGGNPKIQQKDYLPSGVLPIIDQGQKDVAGYVNDLELSCKAPTPCIIFGDHTKILKYVDKPFAMGADGTKILVTSDELFPKYAFYYLQQVRLPDNLGYSRHFKFLKECSIPFPSIPEQKRIAAILDKADAVRRKRQESIRLLDEFLRSVFLEMFGDPVRNEKGWEVDRIEGVIHGIQAGWSVEGEERKRNEDEYAVLKVSSITQGVFNETEYKVINKSVKLKKMITPQKGDLLFSRANTRELVGATCLIKKNYPFLILPDKLWKVSVNEDVMNSCYLKHILSTEHLRNEISKHATGTSGSMLNISMDKFKHILVPIPPISIQNKFSRIAEEVEQNKNMLEKSLVEMENSFNSMIQKAFRGRVVTRICRIKKD
jgi:type I restriction enzyme S subunit